MPASLVVNDNPASPPPRFLALPRKPDQRGPLWILSQPLRMTPVLSCPARDYAARLPVAAGFCDTIPFTFTPSESMTEPRTHRALYASFDRFPSRKGAAVHIDRFARALFDAFDGGLLYVLGGDGLPLHQLEEECEIVRFDEPVPNYLDRAMAFGMRLSHILDGLEESLELCHFRDPWSGVAIALRPGRRYAALFEVNALPSVEIPYLYPAVPEATLEKIRAMELACLSASDSIVCPSHTTAAFLASLGVAEEKIAVIPNGADPAEPRTRPEEAPEQYILYFGAPQAWQGIETLLRAFARLADFEAPRLVICGSRHGRDWKPYEKLATKLGIAERIVWKFALEEDELAGWRQHALVSVAPLTDSPRNVTQGCAPLKILESMAAGVAVVASNLPPVRELIRDRHDGWLIHPDNPSELARALRILLDDPAYARELGNHAQQTIAERYTWDRSLALLRDEYRSMRGELWVSGRRTKP
jgi:glycosyltransferase involved in cell wall biosynthesis